MSPTALRFLALVLLFVAIVFAVEGVLGWVRSRRGGDNAINRRLKMIASGQDRAEVLSRLRRNPGSPLGRLPGLLGAFAMRVERTLHAAGLAASPLTVLLTMVGAVIGLFLLIVIGASVADVPITMGSLMLIATFAFAAGCGVPLIVLARLADRRRNRVQQQFPVALDVFVRGLRAGHPISSALDLLTKEMTDPIGSEFGIVVDEVTYGADLRDALQNMANRWNLADMHMFVVSLSVQSETGGNLAEILENLAQVIRERAAMLMKVRALSSEGRMTALILTALPVLAFVGLFLINPRFYLDVANDPAFTTGFVTLLVLYAVGFYSIRRMVDLKV